MTSQKKIEANRQNAKRSTGAKTSSGRTHAKMNALKSGMYASSFLLPGEDDALYEFMLEAVNEEYRPVGPIEETLVDLIVGDRWRLVRLKLIEGECLHRVLADRWVGYVRKPPPPKRLLRPSRGVGAQTNGRGQPGGCRQSP